MTATYEITFDDPRGSRLAVMDDVYTLNTQKIINNVATLKAEIGTKYDDLFRPDALIEVWRKSEGTASLFDAYFIRAWQYERRYNRERSVIWAQSVTQMLTRRIIAYASGSAYTSKNAPLDNMMKAIVRENLGSLATDTDRQLTSLITVAADKGEAPTAPKSFAYRGVLEVLRDISDLSRTKGTRLYFGFRPYFDSAGLIHFEFFTKVNCLGIDHSTDKQVIFSPEWGNLVNPKLTFDYRESASVVYAGGQGLEADRIVEEREDVETSKQSPWNRVEEFYNCSGQAETVAEVQASGDARLAEMRPRVSFSGELVDTPAARFSKHWDFGDLVTISYRGLQMPAIINSVAIYNSVDGEESVTPGYEIV